MKLILDEGMPRGAAIALRNSGVDASHVLDIGLGGASDATILARAVAEGAAVATLDSDFHQILAMTAARVPSVIRVRIEGLNSAQLAILLLAVLQRASTEMAAGAMVSVGRHSLRIRKLPIKKRG
jgi:predicted nuclease of predicted toxin-antitoxin system